MFSQLSRFYSTTAFSLLAAAGLCACSAGNSSDPAATGSVELALSTVPSDVGCISISASTDIGANVEQYDVSSGQTFSTLMEGLPFGDVQFSGEAFDAACSDVTGATIPSWVSQPVTEEIKPGEVSIVTLVMRRNGRICVEVEFEDDFGALGTPESAACELPKEVGPCDAVIPRYYFNAESGQCERFNYGGCGGNENNFATRSACENQCEPKGQGCVASICDLPNAVAGPCEAAIPRWTFDSAAGVCKRFTYGGCGGNKNNFESKAACEGQCEVPKDPCARLACRADQDCNVFEPTGEAFCADSCEERSCPSGQSCELVDVVCVRAPCPPIAVCNNEG